MPTLNQRRSQQSRQQPVHLRRVLTVRDLVVYGIVLITPIAPVGVFGIVSQMSGGHAATTILLAMIAMSLTAYSYGRMASLYPVAGSAAIYVGRELHPGLGFIAGWAMLLDYLIVPVVNVLYVALTIGRLYPEVPNAVWVIAATAGITMLNVRGIAFTASATRFLLAAMSVVIWIFFICAVRHLWAGGGWVALVSTEPFWKPGTFNWWHVATATSLAALTYIGFDGVTTLAEEVQQPERALPIAAVLTCVFTGVISVALVYAAQRVWPDFQSFSNPETAFLDVTHRVAGVLLYNAMAVVLVVACFASGLAGQASASRLLYGMGRDGQLPAWIFGQLDAVTATPKRNTLLLGCFVLLCALSLNWELAVTLLNFGAFLAFIGVNAAALHSIWHDARARWRACIPLAGGLFCSFIWLSLPSSGKVAGLIWVSVGIFYTVWRRRFRRVRSAGIDHVEV